MTLIVLSDSHGRVDKIEAAVAKNKNAAAILFLGDGLRDLDRAELYGIPVISVRGNCDFYGFSSLCDTPEERVLQFGEYNIMMAHGHSLYVKHGPQRAISRAAEAGADLLLYGHTHERLDKYIPEGEEIGGVVLKKPLRIFNPGSVGAPRDRRYSFGVITIRGKDILTSHGEVN